MLEPYWYNNTEMRLLCEVIYALGVMLKLYIIII